MQLQVGQNVKLFTNNDRRYRGAIVAVDDISVTINDVVKHRLFTISKATLREVEHLSDELTGRRFCMVVNGRAEFGTIIHCAGPTLCLARMQNGTIQSVERKNLHETIFYQLNGGESE